MYLNWKMVWCYWMPIFSIEEELEDKLGDKIEDELDELDDKMMQHLSIWVSKNMYFNWKMVWCYWIPVFSHTLAKIGTFLALF